MNFNECLLKRRKEKGISQEELADQMGVSRQAISKWETGESMPDATKLMALSEVLDISLDELCGKQAVIKTNQNVKAEFKWKTKGIIVAVLCTVLIFGGGYFVGRTVGKNSIGKVMREPQTVVVSLPESFEVSGVNYSHDLVQNKLTVGFVPSFQSDAVTYTLGLRSLDETNLEYKTSAEYKNGTWTGIIDNFKDGEYKVFVYISNEKEKIEQYVHRVTIDGSSTGIN